MKRWWRCSRPVEAPAYRILCVPHAGAGASSFASWIAETPSDVELRVLQLPGRENRLREAPLNDIESITRGAIGEHDDGVPFALYGHSFGALICFELAHQLRFETGHPPLLLAVSGRRAPRCINSETPLAGLSDSAFVAAVDERYGGFPAAVLDNAELLSLLLPALRADMALTEGYQYRKSAVLDFPLLAFGGEADDRVSSAELVQWKSETTAEFASELLPGGHFFHHVHRRRILNRVDEFARQRIDG